MLTQMLRNTFFSKISFLLAPLCLVFFPLITAEASSKTNNGLPLFYWDENNEKNFGDILSVKLIERIINGPIRLAEKKPPFKEKKLLAIGSIFYFARDHDVVWGSGINGKTLQKKDYVFNSLDVRAVRGPLTRAFLKQHFGINAPAIYGDPALLLPYFFPEFKKKENPQFDYIVIPHYSEIKLFPKSNPHVVYPTEPWNVIVEKILNSKLVISSSLHGIIVAEAYGIPARLLRVTGNQNIFKYRDYYLGTNRPYFQYATSVEEAIQMGGEPPFECDLQLLYSAFPFEFWPNNSFLSPDEIEQEER